MGLARTLLALVAVSVAAAPSLAQQLYKYTGPDGKVQYSDRPPPDGAKAERITGRASSVAPPAQAAAASGDAAKADPAKASGPRTPAEHEQEFRKRRLEAQEKASKDAKLAEDRAARDANCAHLRTQLSGVQSGARIAKINAEGERVVLEDDGVQQEAQRLQREIAATCK